MKGNNEVDVVLLNNVLGTIQLLNNSFVRSLGMPCFDFLDRSKRRQARAIFGPRRGLMPSSHATGMLQPGTQLRMGNTVRQNKSVDTVRGPSDMQENLPTAVLQVCFYFLSTEALASMLVITHSASRDVKSSQAICLFRQVKHVTPVSTHSAKLPKGTLGGPRWA